MSKIQTLPNKENIKDVIKDYLYKYNNKKKYKHYREQETCLNSLFEKFSSNNNLAEVLAKVACLNAYYNTNVLALNKMANHIISINNLDEKLANGDIDLISEISNIPTIKRTFYSFATKYCFRYNKDAYYMFDSNVEYVLKCFIRENKLKYSNDDLRSYKTFIDVINDFRRHYNLSVDEYSIRDLDHFMWMFGKERQAKKWGKNA